ncbi:ThuA domain-containing protein [Microbacterium deminutum]|uniref:ThuA domain-containing protein n=1 Tax=Microbacterium deminutum TaxID=344164 RepID=A0ABP5CCN1_9MICO
MTARTALIVRGGWDGHQPVEATEVFVPFLETNGFDIRIEESPAVYADADEMAAIDLIVQSVTMSEAGHDEVMGLRAAVEAGTGLTGWHGGIADSYRASSDYLQLVGGQFVTHPSRRPDLLVEGAHENNYLDYTVQITDLGKRHPITEGVDDFTLTTEQYWVLHDDLNDVLATTTHPTQPWHPWHRPIVSPAVWTRLWGKGRIVVTTPGHTPEVLEHPSVRTIIERGMLWATRTASAS